MKNSLIIKCFILVFASLFFNDTNAQSIESTVSLEKRKKNVYASVFSYGTLLGINYDMRFKKNKVNGLGFSTGFSYVPDWNFLRGKKDTEYKTHNFAECISIPIEVNYLFGKKNHFFKIGLGYLYLYSWNEVNFTFNPDETSLFEFKEHYIYLPLAYRFQAVNKGLFFEVAINTAIASSLGGTYMEIFPGINIGYSF